MATPLGLWLFNEAASGTTPTSVLDSSTGTAVNLTPTYTGTAAWSSLGSGRGLDLGTALTAGARSTSGSIGKIRTALSASKVMTWELVIDYDAAASSGGTICDLAGQTNQSVGLYMRAGGTVLDFYYSGDQANACYSITMPTTRTVVHVVYDSAQATAGNRFKVYFGGTLQTLTAGVGITLNSALIVDTDAQITTGFDVNGIYGIDGIIYYLAVYAAALSSGEVSANATALAANDDVDPNAGGGSATNAVGTRSGARSGNATSTGTTKGPGTRSGARSGNATATANVSTVPEPAMFSGASFGTAVAKGPGTRSGARSGNATATAAPVVGGLGTRSGARSGNATATPGAVTTAGAFGTRAAPANSGGSVTPASVGGLGTRAVTASGGTSTPAPLVGVGTRSGARSGNATASALPNVTAVGTRAPVTGSAGSATPASVGGVGTRSGARSGNAYATPGAVASTGGFGTRQAPANSGGAATPASVGGPGTRVTPAASGGTATAAPAGAVGTRTGARSGNASASAAPIAGGFGTRAGAARSGGSASADPIPVYAGGFAYPSSVAQGARVRGTEQKARARGVLF